MKYQILKGYLWLAAFTRYVLSFFETQKLKPLLCQRVVSNHTLKIATALDILCVENCEPPILWVCELKSGYAGNRKLPATQTKAAKTVACRLQKPFERAFDCMLTRHMAQASLGRELLVSEQGLTKRLYSKFGISKRNIKAAVIYVNGNGVDMVVPGDWWTIASSRALEMM